MKKLVSLTLALLLLEKSPPLSVRLRLYPPRLIPTSTQRFSGRSVWPTSRTWKS